MANNDRTDAILLTAKTLITAVHIFNEWRATREDLSEEEIAEKVLRSEALAAAVNAKVDATE